MAINRNYIISKVKQAIKQLPYQGVVLRENINKRNEKVGYNKISTVTGVLYSEDSNKTTAIIIQDKGQILPNTSKNYLLPYDETTNCIKENDLILISNKFYKVQYLGENLEMFYEMRLEEVQGLSIEGDYVLENNKLFEILELGNEFNLKFQ